MFNSVILLSFLVTQGYALQSGLFFTNSDCSCPGHDMSFECVINGVSEGTTVWKGSAIQDACTSLQEISLLHGVFASGIGGTSECGGGIVAWRTIGVENGSYVSQLNITFNTDLIGKEVVCAYDNLEEEITIGSSNISINANLTTYPPPSGIHLENANEDYLTFIWDPIAPDCTAIRYIITSTDCGKCPDTTIHNSVICNEFPMSTNGSLCIIAIQSEFCPGRDNMYQTIGNMSGQIYVTLKVPEPPTVSAVISRYSYLTGITTGFIIKFSKVRPFEYNGINGSTVSYNVAYNINSAAGVSCGSATCTVPASSCVNGVCQHSFTYKGSACNSPSVGVNISISAANVLGSGPAGSYTAVKEATNTFLSASLSMVSNHALCTFHGQQTANAKSCSIDYWLKEDEACTSKSVVITQTSYSTLNDVTIGLPLSSLPSGRYCFNVMGDNGTYTAILEGTFDIHFDEIITTQDNQPQATNRILLGLSLTVVILISFIIVTVLILIILFLLRVFKKTQVERVIAQTAAMNSSTTMNTVTECTRAEFKPNSGRVYEELDGDGSDQVVDVQSLPYPRKDCVPPPSDSGEAADSASHGNSFGIYYDMTHFPGRI